MLRFWPDVFKTDFNKFHVASTSPPTYTHLPVKQQLGVAFNAFTVNGWLVTSCGRMRWTQRRRARVHSLPSWMSLWSLTEDHNVTKKKTSSKENRGQSLFFLPVSYNWLYVNVVPNSDLTLHSVEGTVTSRRTPVRLPRNYQHFNVL